MKPTLLAIVGPTASGKSELGIRIARQFNGEIIAADSRTVYRGMDIGAAKPSRADQARIRHHLLDITEPGQRFSVSQYKQLASQAIADIRARSKLAILVGGSGLYIDAVLLDYRFNPNGKADPNNPRHRLHGGKPNFAKLIPGSLVVGLSPPPEQLKARIAERAQRMFADGVINEANNLLKSYGAGALDRSGGLVYKICQRVLAGEITKDEAIELFKTADWQYARRQRTWFKRNPNIVWFEQVDDAFDYVLSQLSK